MTHNTTSRMSSGLFSQRTDEWYTPRELVKGLADHYAGGQFTLDAAATAVSAKAPQYYDEQTDALRQDWHADAGGGVVWLNPPFSNIKPFLAKAVEAARQATTVVCVLPARIDTGWWHDHVMDHASEVLAIRGRVKFERPDGVGAAGAPFPTAIVVFGPQPHGASFPRAGRCLRDGTVSYRADEPVSAPEEDVVPAADEPAANVIPFPQGGRPTAPDRTSVSSGVVEAGQPKVRVQGCVELGHRRSDDPSLTA